MSNLIYKNTNATRNKPITRTLFGSISYAIYLVFGPDYYAHIYSGGQDRRGKGAKRIGSVRHDDYGKGGKAADIYVYNKDGVKLAGVDLAPLAQYWLAMKLGAVGIEMNRGGVHLDEWVKPPKGGGMHWNYRKDWKQPTHEFNTQRQAIADGVSGIIPPLYQPPLRR